MQFKIIFVAPAIENPLDLCYPGHSHPLILVSAERATISGKIWREEW